jgi:chemotaxis protein methyltransferase CheR
MKIEIEIEIDLKDIKYFIEEFKNISSYDFSGYALSSFKRRLQRVFTILKVDTVNELLAKIKANKNLAEQIVEEITVNTTEMFRDPEMWASLKLDTLPNLLAKKDKLKIWIAACSSGEEVYSLLILLHELNALHRTEILASDINDLVLQNAQNGLFPTRNVEAYENNYKSALNSNIPFSNFYKISDLYNVVFDNSLLVNTKFQKINLTKIPDIESFDLIFIRNVLIYFNMELQDNIISEITKKLNPKSFLIIGSKENIIWCKAAKQFKLDFVKEKIYQKID